MIITPACPLPDLTRDAYSDMCVCQNVDTLRIGCELNHAHHVSILNISTKITKHIKFQN